MLQRKGLNSVSRRKFGKVPDEDESRRAELLKSAASRRIGSISGGGKASAGPATSPLAAKREAAMSSILAKSKGAGVAAAVPTASDGKPEAPGLLKKFGEQKTK